MSTYEAIVLEQVKAGDPSGFNNGFPVDTFTTGAPLDPTRKTDNPNNPFDQTAPKPLQPGNFYAGDPSGFQMWLSGLVLEGLLRPETIKSAVINGAAPIFSGDLWEALQIVILAQAFNEDDFQVLAGRVFDAETGEPIPNVRIFFEGTTLTNEYRASRADATGGYIAILTPLAEYNIAGALETTCKVYELVRVETFPNRTDIYLQVPPECAIPEPIIMPGEPIEDLLNREIGIHDYEPVKIAGAIRPDKELLVDGQQAAVGVGIEVAVVDFVADAILLIQSLPISADGDAEFYFVIGDALGNPSIPRRRLNVDVPQDDLMQNGASQLAVNAGQRVRIMGKNVSNAPVLLEASVIGKKA